MFSSSLWLYLGTSLFGCFCRLSKMLWLLWIMRYSKFVHYLRARDLASTGWSPGRWICSRSDGWVFRHDSKLMHRWHMIAYGLIIRSAMIARTSDGARNGSQNWGLDTVGLPETLLFTRLLPVKVWMGFLYAFADSFGGVRRIAKGFKLPSWYRSCAGLASVAKTPNWFNMPTVAIQSFTADTCRYQKVWRKCW